MAKRAELAGEQFGFLSVVRRSDTPGGKWHCRCICGQTKEVRTCHLKEGRVTSCGCMANVGRSQKLQKHGMYDQPEYTTYYNMLQRCHNPQNRSYDRYGGRGIVVCDRWRESFEIFLEDMGRRPSPDLSIDRINNEGPYSPENCRWATWDVQRRNKRPRKTLTLNGVTLGFKQWAEKLNIQPQTLRLRLAKHPPEIALTMKKGSRN